MNLLALEFEDKILNQIQGNLIASLLEKAVRSTEDLTESEAI